MQQRRRHPFHLRLMVYRQIYTICDRFHLNSGIPCLHLAVDVRQTQLELVNMRLYARIGWHEATLETELCHGAGLDDGKVWVACVFGRIDSSWVLHGTSQYEYTCELRDPCI